MHEMTLFFNPFNTRSLPCVSILSHNNKFTFLQHKINEEDEYLVALKDELGEAVMNTVVTAFLEIEEYNASGRYPVNVAWDFLKNRRVTLKDLLLHLKELLDNGVPPKPKKRTRAQRVY